MSKIELEREKCIGCGACVSVCDEVFEMGKDGKARVKAQKELPCVEEAITSCPTSAIIR